MTANPLPRPNPPEALRIAAPRRWAAAALLCLALPWRPAGAADLTGIGLEELMNIQLPPAGLSSRFLVSTTAVNSCIASAGDLLFSPYDPQATEPNDGTAQVTVSCTEGSPYNIGLDAGIGPGASVTARQLSSGGNTLKYSLFRDPARNLNWGNTVGIDTTSGSGTGSPTVHTVYGRIWSRQAVKAGVYADTITIVVTY